MKIRFHPEAEVELHEALQWYSRQRKGLEAEFMLCVDEALQRISRNPELYPVVHRNARRVIVRRFPFVVFYECGEQEIKVLAVFHSRRNPDRWRLRR